jgi:hypothetical protein
MAEDITRARTIDVPKNFFFFTLKSSYSGRYPEDCAGVREIKRPRQNFFFESVSLRSSAFNSYLVEHAN